jgi:hypothetical protein
MVQLDKDKNNVSQGTVFDDVTTGVSSISFINPVNGSI